MTDLIYTQPQKRKMSTRSSARLSSARLSTAARVSPRNHSSTKERLRQKTPEPVAKKNRLTAPNAPRKAKRETGMRLAPDSPMSRLLSVARQALERPAQPDFNTETAARASPEPVNAHALFQKLSESYEPITPEPAAEATCILLYNSKGEPLTLDDLEDKGPETILVVGEALSSDNDEDEEEPDVDCACEAGPCIENKLVRATTTMLPVLSVQNIQFLLDLHKEREKHFKHRPTNSPKDVLREKLVLHQLMSYVLRQGVDRMM